jgi:toxin YoeB
MAWRVVFTDQAVQDAARLEEEQLLTPASALLELLRENPHQNPPAAVLVGDLSGAYSRRISFHHRLIYELLVEEQIVKVIRMWTLA